MQFIPAKHLLLESTASYFNDLNIEIASQYVLECILIAIQDENKADCNENFKIYSGESVEPLYKW